MYCWVAGLEETAEKPRANTQSRTAGNLVRLIGFAMGVEVILDHIRGALVRERVLTGLLAKLSLCFGDMPPIKRVGGVWHKRDATQVAK
jgi:hypothetical protein